MTTEKSALSTLDQDWLHWVEELKNLVRIPSVSFPGWDPKEIDRSAEAVAALMKKTGLNGVEILRVPGAFPYVYGEWLGAPGKPTLLLYAHHDVQPPGREEVWKTKPFEPVMKEGPGGERIYGRGAADDKAGVIAHLATIDAFLKTNGKLPVNVKIVIEGEEEIGSEHLTTFLKTYQSKLDADVLLLTDTSNFDCGVPQLTVALRGMVALEVEVRALSKTVHSGMWGGPLPDPVMGLSKVIAKMMDEEGRILIPGVMEGWKAPNLDEIASMQNTPYDEKSFREQTGLVEGAKILSQGAEKNISPLHRVWRFPSLTVTGIQASQRGGGNIINDVAWARVTLRLAPGMSAEIVMNSLKRFIEKEIPWGLEVEFKGDSLSDPWMTDYRGAHRKTFEIAIQALEKGYGHKVELLGCGGSIPFVEPFSDALGGAPCLLVGVEDPYTNAHGENESLLVSDLKKTCASMIHLYSNLSN